MSKPAAWGRFIPPISVLNARVLPASIAGLVAWRWRSSTARLTNKGFVVRFAVVCEGAAPAPYHKLLLPPRDPPPTFGFRKDSAVSWETKLLVITVLTDGATAPESAVPRDPQSYNVLL